MPSRFPSEPRTLILLLVLGVLVLVSLITYFSHQEPAELAGHGPASAGDTMEGHRADSSALVESAPGEDAAPHSPGPPPTGVGRGATAPVREIPFHADAGAMEVAGKIETWEDWSYNVDSRIRKCALVFDYARLDTIEGGGIAFSPSGRAGDRFIVKRVVCLIDSIRGRVSYTFPGQAADFSVGVGVASRITLAGELQPGKTTCLLTPRRRGGVRTDDGPEAAQNQIVVELSSPPGHAYTLRLGVECGDVTPRGATRTFITSPATVEFRRTVSFRTFIPGGSDSLLILTSNPRAIRELAGSLDGRFLSAVFVPVEDRSEADPLFTGPLPGVSLHITAPAPTGESFIVFDDRHAIIEETEIDPGLLRVAHLTRRTVDPEEVGLPRVNRLVTDRADVDRLRSRFLHAQRNVPR